MSLAVPECLDSNNRQECFYHLCLPKSLQPFLSDAGLTQFSVPLSPLEQISVVHGILSNTAIVGNFGCCGKWLLPYLKRMIQVFKVLNSLDPAWFWNHLSGWLLTAEVDVMARVQAYSLTLPLFVTLNLEGAGYKELGNLDPMDMCLTFIFCTFWAFD